MKISEQTFIELGHVDTLMCPSEALLTLKHGLNNIFRHFGSIDKFLTCNRKNFGRADNHEKCGVQ